MSSSALLCDANPSPEAAPALTLLRPNTLLAATQSPRLLRHLDPARGHCAVAHQLLHSEQTLSEALRHFASDSFAMAVVPAAPATEMAELVRELVRVTRQGLITFS